MYTCNFDTSIPQTRNSAPREAREKKTVTSPSKTKPETGQPRVSVPGIGEPGRDRHKSLFLRRNQ